VTAIQRANNFVYVTDVHEGPLVDWVLISGLTQEEAALIQPGYQPPPFEGTIAQLMAGGSLSRNGLRYENFFLAGGVPLVPGVPFIPTNAVERDHVGVATFTGPWDPPDFGGRIEPQFDDWLFLGSFQAGGLGAPMPNQPWIIIYNFDVIAEQLGTYLTAASLHTNPNFTFNYVQGPGAAISVNSKVHPRGMPSGPTLADLHLQTTGEFGGFLFGEDEEAFAPQQALTVRTIVEMTGPAEFTGMIHSFELVPEPAALALSGFGGLALIRRRQRSITRSA
jgi:hypothetical protein